MADTSLAEPRWNFSQTFGGHRAQPTRAGTAPLWATPLRSESSIIEYFKPNQWIRRLKQRGLPQGHTAGSSVQFRAVLCAAPVHFVKQTGLELVILDLILGQRPAATHSTRQPLKYRRESDPSTTSNPTHSPARSLPLPSTALTHSLTTAGAPPPTHSCRRRQLRPRHPHHPDGGEWYILSECNHTWTEICCQVFPRKRSVH